MNENIIWNIYGGALLPYVPCYENVSVSKSEIKRIIRQKKVLFARWTNDFDCKFPTEWWYCLRDTPIELTEFKSKVRNEINRGLKTTDYVMIDLERLDDVLSRLCDITNTVFAEYPKAYRKKMEIETMRKNVLDSVNGVGDYWVCIDKATSEIVGYCECVPRQECMNLTQVRVLPQYLRNRVNAGLVYTLCSHYLNTGQYRFLCDGQRNIRHVTNYQSFLVKQLGFRYAYCRLNIEYCGWMKMLVAFMYPFRNILKKVSRHSSVLYNAYCLLKQEEYARSFR